MKFIGDKFMEQYTDKVMDHFRNPRNVGEIADADGIGEVGNVKCGDVMYIYIKVGRRPLYSSKGKVASSKGNKEIDSTTDSHATSHQLSPPLAGSRQNAGPATEFEEFIEDIKFKTLGCAAAIAASSMMCELAKGKSLADAENISRDDINDSLGKLPAPKYHCSILSAEGIHKAIADYRSKRGDSNTDL